MSTVEDRDAMMHSLPGRKSETIRRTIEANRAVYDSLRPAPGKAESRLSELESALTQTQNKLQAIECSTIWRSTKKLRQLIQAARNLKSQTERSPIQLENSKPTCNLTYQEWIDTEEPEAMDALLQRNSVPVPEIMPKLGLALWTHEASECAIAWQLDIILSRIPTTCDVLLVCPERAVRTVAEVQRVVRPSLMVEAGEVFASIFSIALRRMDPTYLCFHHLADRIAEPALQIVTAALANQPQTDLLFTDEDWIDESARRSRPFFKPGWDVELQRGQDLVGPFAFYRTANLRRLRGFEPSGPAWRYDLVGRVVAECLPERVQHLPVVLCHRQALLPEGSADAMHWHAKMHLQSNGIIADIEPVEGPEPWHRVIYALPRSAPLVSIIIPTRDRVELLQTCTTGVLSKTSYPEIELVIVDNGTEEASALALISVLSQDHRVKVLRQPGPFNWSALNNAGVSTARGDIIVLLNNDINILRHDWLDSLVALVIQPDVGAVGAKLLYQDGRVQHAGITTDIQGVPRHLFRYSKPEEAGPSGMLALTRSVWAVTGACLAIRREVLVGVGGLDEGLPVAYNDVDLCMRLAIQGYRIVWTPNAVLGHHEHASRPPDHIGARREQVREELNRLTRNWGNLVLSDPFINPNYELVAEHLAFRNRTKRSVRG